MSLPVVSIVIPAYNAGAFLDETIASAHAQSVPCEVICVDDASQDDATSQVLSRWEAVPGVTVVRLATNGGVSRALNEGCARAAAAYVLPLGADDLLEPTYAEAGATVLDADPDVAIVSSPMQTFGAAEILLDDFGAPNGVADILFTNRIPGASMFRWEAWHAVGGFTPDLPWGEDWDFWLRVLARGGRSVMLGQPLYRYRLHEQQASQRLDRRTRDRFERETMLRNRDIYESHVATLIHAYRDQCELNVSYRRRFGRANDLANGLIDLGRGGLTRLRAMRSIRPQDG